MGEIETTRGRGFNRAVAVHEASREAGKLGRLIKSVLGTQTKRFVMTYIKSADGIIVSDEVLIHDMVTKHSNEWFAVPEYSKTSPLHISPTWRPAVDSVDAFLEATETSCQRSYTGSYTHPCVLMRTHKRTRK